MTEVDRLAAFANVPRELAMMLSESANRAGVSIRSFRSDDRRPHLVAERQRFILRARDRGYGSVLIGRALSRDSSTILNADRRARALVSAGRLLLRPPARPVHKPVQLDFLPGPLFEVAA